MALPVRRTKPPAPAYTERAGGPQANPDCKHEIRPLCTEMPKCKKGLTAARPRGLRDPKNKSVPPVGLQAEAQTKIRKTVAATPRPRGAANVCAGANHTCLRDWPVVLGQEQRQREGNLSEPSLPFLVSPSLSLSLSFFFSVLCSSVLLLLLLGVRSLHDQGRSGDE